MSKKATEFQKKEMSKMYRGKEIFKPLNTGWIDENVACVRTHGLHPYFITGYTGWTDNFAFAFAHKDKRCSPFKKRVHDSSAPYDAYDESDDTEENAKSGFLKGVGR